MKTLPLLLAIALVAPGCATLQVRIDRREKPLNQAGVPVETAATPARRALAEAAAKKPDDAARLTGLVEAARMALRENDPAVYNAAVGELARVAVAEDFQPLALGSGQRLVCAGRTRDTLDPRAAGEVVPSNHIRIRGIVSRSESPGWGVPYALWYPKDSPVLAGQPGVPASGMAFPATAVLEFRDSAPVLVFRNAMKADHARLGGRTRELATDFSAPIALLLSKGRNRSIDVGALLRTKARMDDAMLVQLQPYDPDKIPVVFVHGLLSRPEAWARAANELLADPVIRERYQFWFFSYPTGLPVWASTAVLRRELDRFQEELGGVKNNPNLNDMVLVGHSMGGLISSLMVREGGKRLWQQFSDVPPERVRLSPEAREHIKELIFFRANRDVDRVIFVATPHRGSQLALRPIAGFFAKLIQLPFTLNSSDWTELRQAMRDDARSLFVAPANSIRFLKAESPLLLSILRLPASPRVKFHSIIGDRGRGNTPDSSDGVVPYWSSHLDGVVSEKIVPSGHGANENPEGIEEMRRILVEGVASPHAAE